MGVLQALQLQRMCCLLSSLSSAPPLPPSPARSSDPAGPVLHPLPLPLLPPAAQLHPGQQGAVCAQGLAQGAVRAAAIRGAARLRHHQQRARRGAARRSGNLAAAAAAAAGLQDWTASARLQKAGAWLRTLNQK
jgi:hypothetical protein